MIYVLKYAEHAVAIAQGRQREDLDSDIKLRNALLYCITIIGEAATTIPDDTRNRFPGIPCAVIVRMRHRLGHDYDMIAEDVVWETIQRDLPALIERIVAVIPPEQI